MWLQEFKAQSQIIKVRARHIIMRDFQIMILQDSFRILQALM